MALRSTNFQIFNLSKSGKFCELIDLLQKVCEQKKQYTVDFSPEKLYSCWTALHFCAAGGDKGKHAAEKLLELGWSSTLKGRDGRSPLHLAKERKHASLIRILEWYTPLSISQRESSPEKLIRRKQKRHAGKIKPTVEPRPVNHIVPCEYPDMEPDEGYFTFDELVSRWKNIDPNWKAPRSKFLP